MSMLGAVGYGGSPAVWQRTQYAGNLSAARSASVVTGPQNADGASPTAKTGATAISAAPVALYEPELPEIPEGYGPIELATRTRVQFPDLGTPLSNALEGKLAGLENEAEQEAVSGVDDAKSVAEAAEDAKCETCEKRKYQDGSDDPGVSFKTPTNVDPKMAAYAVRGHEQEHVVRERAAAEREGRKVVNQTVTYHTGICPECGKFYVSGGTTRTVTAEDNSDDFFDIQERDKTGFEATA